MGNLVHHRLWFGYWLVPRYPGLYLSDEVRFLDHVEELLKVLRPYNLPRGDSLLDQNLAPLELDGLRENLSHLHEERVGLHVFQESGNPDSLPDLQLAE